jgi:hypothetical protein
MCSGGDGEHDGSRRSPGKGGSISKLYAIVITHVLRDQGILWLPSKGCGVAAGGGRFHVSRPIQYVLLINLLSVFAEQLDDPSRAPHSRTTGTESLN